MPPSGAKFPTCWKMHRRASHAIFIHRRGFSTFRRECVASQRVAGHIAMEALRWHSVTRFRCIEGIHRNGGLFWFRLNSNVLNIFFAMGMFSYHNWSKSSVGTLIFDFDGLAKMSLKLTSLGIRRMELILIFTLMLFK